MKKIIIAIIFFIFSIHNLSAKGYYLIKLKGGTTIKADAISREDGYIKVYKFGGYIIYPSKNIKSVKYVEVLDNVTINETKNKPDECVLSIKEFKAVPLLNPETGKFNVKLKGIILNDCPVEFKDIKLIVQFLGDNRDKLREEVLNYKELKPFDKIIIDKIFHDVDADLIKYYKYQLEYKRVE